MHIPSNSYPALLSEHNLALLSDWLRETHELLVIIDLPHSGGLTDIYIIKSLIELRKILSSQTWPEAHISIFREKQFPIRGQVNDVLIEQTLETLVQGQPYSIIELRDYPNPCIWIDEGTSHGQIKEILENLKDKWVGIGIDPFKTVKLSEQDAHKRVFWLHISKNQNHYEPFAKDPEHYADILDEWNRPV